MTQIVRIIFVAALAATMGFASALVLPPQQQHSRRLTVVGAKTPLSANGKKIEVPEGSSMIAACRKLGINVPTNCKKGDCGTCTVSVGGKQIRACVGKVPPAPKLKSVAEKGLPVKLAR